MSDPATLAGILGAAAPVLELIAKLKTDNATKQVLSLAVAQRDDFKTRYDLSQKDLMHANARVLQLTSQVTEAQKERDDTKLALELLRKQYEEHEEFSGPYLFRRGRRTRNLWMAVCPSCGKPVIECWRYDLRANVIGCTACTWHVRCERGTLAEAEAGLSK